MNFSVVSPEECRQKYRRNPTPEMFRCLCELTLSKDREMAEVLGIEIPGRTFDQARAFELYEQGRSDRSIARELGVAPSTIGKWRKDRDLPPHDYQTPEDHRRMRLYRKGLTDAECAKRLGIAVTSFRSWRYKKHLKPNKMEAKKK